MSTTNRTVVVTGAAGGIGRALALLLAEEEVPLLLIDVDAEGLKEVGAATDADLLVADLGSWSGIDTAISALADLEDPWGLVNNAGVYRGNPLATYDRETIEHDYRVNVLAPMLMTQAFAEPLLERERHGSVIHVSSTAGEVGSSDAVYGSSKSAVLGLTKSQAWNYAPWVRVNCVSPGMVRDTAIEGRIPEYRHREYARQEQLQRTRLDARSVAEVMHLLLTPATRNLTGKVIPVDNGAYPR